MKEITRIHLAATPFNIEVGAKKELEMYIDAIEVALHADVNAMREIEARMVELLQECGVSGEKVVTAKDVQEVTERLGSPSDFADDDMSASNDDAVSSQPKRLFRDNDKGLLGGVLAGIGAYYGINPNWIRLVVILLTFVSFGTVTLIYIAMWLAVPVARTAAERLQMMGKPVTLTSLAHTPQQSTVEPKAKPLVIVLRALVGIGFVGIALGALAMVVFALLAGLPTIVANNELVNGWIIAAFGLFTTSGILLALLSAVFAFALFAWKFTKPMAYTCLAVIVAGIVTFTAGVGSVVYESQIARSDIEQRTTNQTTQLPELRNARTVRFENKSVPVEYRVSNEAPRVEIRTVEKDNKGISVQATQNDTGLTIKVNDNERRHPAIS
jgi:phage shock protein PspC (stress-responsive transcriptional regulator)